MSYNPTQGKQDDVSAMAKGLDRVYMAALVAEMKAMVNGSSLEEAVTAGNEILLAAGYPLFPLPVSS